jgi:hypothetical protein
MFKPLLTCKKRSSISSTALFTSILFTAFLTREVCGDQASSPELENLALSDSKVQAPSRGLEKPILSNSSNTQPSQSNREKQEPSYSKVQPMIEFKAGYFFFAESKMRKIYDNGGFDLQVSGSYPVWRWLQIYGSVEYLQCQGKSLNGHQRTKIWELPVSVGLRPVFTIYSKAQYYFTLGPRYFYVHQHNRSSFVNKNRSHSGIGGFVNTGFLFYPYYHFLIDIFGEYAYERVHVHSSKHNVQGRGVQVGGFTFGVGLGYAF